MTEKLMTFGMLCAIKREQLGYSFKEIYKRTGVSNIRNIERGVSMPRKKAKKALIKYFRITNEELSACKDNDLSAISAKLNNIEQLKLKKDRICLISRLIEELIDNVKELDLTGHIGEHVKQSSLEQLAVAKSAISDLCILDKLL